ncbi:MAG: CHAT domain-containing protein, partial [Steroidobacteraceae bacterium]
GLRRRGALPNDVLWIDPIDITIGRLTALCLPSKARIVPLGAVLFTYLKLRLHLRSAGFDAVLYPYDWRLDIGDLGRQLAARIREEPAPRIAIVAHSMGGLVGRAALATRGAPDVERFVMLGTPNFGSFAPVQALRGTYAVVRKIARLDLRHSAEDLAQYVFSTFPSLYQLLPARGRLPGPDLFDPQAWPTKGPSPRPELLAAARNLEQGLAAADERFHVVVGVDQETVTSIARERDDFVYTVTRFGDGTVPAACAVLPGASHYYAPVAHSELTRSANIAAAVADLLREGSTRRLATRATPTRSGSARISDADLRRRLAGKIDWTGLEPEQRRAFLATLNEPPKLRLRPDVEAPARRAATRARGAREAARLEFRIVEEDIAEARADALVAGVFQNVRPAGALAAIDRHLDGVIEEFAARRMLPREVGGLLPVPVHGRLAHADHVLLVGIGRFDQLSERAIELAAENVARFCARTHIGRIATVLWGSGAGLPAPSSLTAQMRGYLRGVGEADRDGTIRSITFCVRRPAGIGRLSTAARALLAGVRLPERRVTLHVEDTRARRGGAAAPAAPPSPVPSTAYLLVNEERATGDGVGMRAALLTAGRQAAVITEVQPFALAALAEHLRKLNGQDVTFARLAAFGGRLADLTLHPTIHEALESSRRDALVVVHDAPTSRVPWETLCFDGRFPATEGGVSRRYAAEQLVAAKFSEGRRERRELSVLLVADPTNDLPGARLERDRILALLREQPDTRVVVVEGRAATRARLRAEFVSGAYDLLHYAGHAFFDAADPAASGIRCSDRVLSGADLHALEQLPALVVFNACESGRIRRARTAPHPPSAPSPRRAGRGMGEGRRRESAGLAEVFLRGGVANYVGTWWPVADASALAFAESLYAGLLRGASIGDAVVAGRAAVRALRSIDWADYMHYGDPDFCLKKRAPQ